MKEIINDFIHCTQMEFLIQPPYVYGLTILVMAIIVFSTEAIIDYFKDKKKRK